LRGTGYKPSTPQRSKWYHNYGYGNLRDYGLADKKAVIEQLADRHDYIDLERVGIYGHSGGGFMSTAAMLVYPDFFKCAVSSSGNHGAGPPGAAKHS
jgi:dipeptidyl aminopeptidase/acylaminoacyl peptidase